MSHADEIATAKAGHHHHHGEHDADDPSPEQMAAVKALPLPGVGNLLALFLHLAETYGAPLVWGVASKAVYRALTGSKAKAQALPDGKSVVDVTDNARGTKFRSTITKDSNI